METKEKTKVLKNKYYIGQHVWGIILKHYLPCTCCGGKKKGWVKEEVEIGAIIMDKSSIKYSTHNHNYQYNYFFESEIFNSPAKAQVELEKRNKAIKQEIKEKLKKKDEPTGLTASSIYPSHPYITLPLSS